MQGVEVKVDALFWGEGRLLNREFLFHYYWHIKFVNNYVPRDEFDNLGTIVRDGTLGYVGA